VGRQLHVGPKSVVHLEPESGVVTKTYLASAYRTPREAAATEFARMTRLHGALSSVDGVSCPRPLDWGRQDDAWVLRMELLAGTSVLELMRLRDRPAPTALAPGIARALEVYGEVFAEPHFGLNLQDVFFDAESGEVGILDFEPCSRSFYLADAVEGVAPAVASAAIYLGLSLHLASSPHMLGNRAGARWLVDVAAETAREVAITRPEEFRALLRTVYRRRYEKGSVRWRRVWYRLRWADVGRPALRRAVVRDGHVAPRGLPGDRAGGARRALESGGATPPAPGASSSVADESDLSS
jgi:hypothetical protein